MRDDLMFGGVGMCLMSIGLAYCILCWSVGPEFWWFVLGFLVFGVGCVVEAWRMV
jgi:hypothetical protein